MSLSTGASVPSLLIAASYTTERLRDSVYRFGGGDDRNTLEEFQVEQVRIAGNDQIGGNGQCCGEHGIVISVDAGTADLGRLDDTAQRGVTVKQILGLEPSRGQRFGKFLSQDHSGEFLQQRHADKQDGLCRSRRSDQTPRHTAPHQA